MSPRDGQEGIEGTRGPPSVAESNANTRFAVARVPMAPLGAGRFFFLGAGGGDFLLVGVSGGVGPSGGSRGLEAVSLGFRRGGGKHQVLGLVQNPTAFLNAYAPQTPHNALISLIMRFFSS